jgi:hypothetical protein
MKFPPNLFFIPIEASLSKYLPQAWRERERERERERDLGIVTVAKNICEMREG